MELLESSCQDGALERPFTHVVIQERAERNHGSDAALVPKIEHRGHARIALNVQKTVFVRNA